MVESIRHRLTPWLLCVASVGAAGLLSGIIGGAIGPAAAGETRRPIPTLEFTLPGEQEGGLLVPGQAFVLSVRLTDWQPPRKKEELNEELVVIFDSPAFPRRLLPLTPDGASKDPATSVVFEPRPFAVGAGDKALRIEVTVARLHGMRIEQMLKRTVYLTLTPAAPAPSSAAAPPPAPDAVPADPDPAPPAPADETASAGQPVLPPEEVQEEDLGSPPPLVQSPVYWKTVRELLGRRWQHQLGQFRKGQAGRGLRVRFRLYSGGAAQLIQIERTSGNAAVDEAGLRAVLASLPFPPFPPSIQESSVEVHLDLPGAKP